MGRATFRASESGIREVLSCGAVRGLVSSAAESAVGIAEGLSESGRAKYRAKVGVRGDRVRALVGTTDVVSRRSNARHNSLEKARRNARP